MKKCLYCKKELKKKKSYRESRSHFARRKFCNLYCKNTWMSYEWRGVNHPDNLLKAFIGYFKNELDVKPKQRFEYSTRWGLPVYPYNNLMRVQIQNIIKYGIEKKRLRLVKRGHKFPYQPSQYVFYAH